MIGTRSFAVGPDFNRSSGTVKEPKRRKRKLPKLPGSTSPYCRPERQVFRVLGAKQFGVRASTKGSMPEKQTLERARRDKRQGKAASTQAGEFVREEMHHIREGKHGARSTKQAIAIGLSKARRAGVNLRPPRKGQASAKTRKSAASALRKGKRKQKTSRTRSRARLNALKREGHRAASHKALSKQARSAARRRGPAKRRMAARKAARTRSHGTLEPVKADSV
jgi:uncharacterized protein DUF6496